MQIDDPKILEAPLTSFDQHEEFLRLLSEGCTVRQAAAGVNLDWSGLYKRKKKDPKFSSDWENAQKVSVQKLIQEAERRAMRGSDRLLMFLLSSYDPEKFKSRASVHHQGEMNQTIQVITGVPSAGIADLI